MNTKMKKVLSGVLSLLVFVALIAIAPVSRIVYSIYDTNRTNEILAQLEAEKNQPDPEEPVVNDFQKQAFFKEVHETDGGKTIEKFDLLVLTSDSGYELSYYERVVEGENSYTSEYFHMTGSYTREGNVLTVTPGIGAMAQRNDGGSYVYFNAQYLTAEEAGSDKTRDEIYDMKYSSRQIALMSDGTFVVGGESDATDVLGAPEGRQVYTSFVAQGRKTYNTLVTLDAGIYFVYNHATNSNNAEQTTGCLFGIGSFEIKDDHKAIVPDESKPEETYAIVTGEPGIGFMYANNNGSHMHFDLQTSSGFSMWLSTSFNASSPTFYVTESGCTIKIGALKTVVDPWGLYVPTGDSEEPEEPTEPGEPVVAGDIRLELETSVEGKPFILELKTDGTLTTGWTNYEQTMQNGTWRIVDGTLVLNVGYSSTIVENAEGGLDITVNYGQMGEKTYTMTADQFAALKSIELPAESVKLEIETSVEGKPFVLELNADGTLLTGWTNYEQTMKEGTWAIVDGALVLTVDYESTVVENAEGGLDITVNYGQMGEKTYTLTAAQFAGLRGEEAPAGVDVKLEIETSVEGKPFVLELNADGTLLTGWTNYEQTMKEGTWAIVDGALVLTVDYESTVVENAEGGLDITVNYGQMGEKTYTLSADLFAAMQNGGKPVAEVVRLELETSVEGKPFVLVLNDNGTLQTGWTNYEQTMKDGKWCVIDGTLVLNVEYASTVAQNAEGGLDITVNYGQMGEKIYTLTADQVAALQKVDVPFAEVVRLELETSVEGKPFVLVLNDNGTLQTGWTNYAQTMKTGTWAIVDGTLVLTVDYEATVTQNAEGGLDITVNYGQMGEKIYTLTAAQFAALRGEEAPAGVDIKVELETSVAGKPFVLELNADGTLRTGWTNYEQTMKDGTWAVVDGALVLTMDYEATVTQNAEGGLDITVNYGQMGEKTYTLTAEQAKAILG